jgi:hypothetical protein
MELNTRHHTATRFRICACVLYFPVTCCSATALEQLLVKLKMHSQPIAVEKIVSSYYCERDHHLITQ